MSHDCTHLLHRVAEPLATLAWLRGANYAAERYEAWDRLLLQNSVHDCICGVSIDQVHEKMEDIYRKVFDGALADCEQSIQHILCDFAPGTYAVSTDPFANPTQVLFDNERTYRGNRNGIGVWPLESLPTPLPQQETASMFSYGDERFQIEIGDGTIQINNRPIYFVLRAEGGDTYSDETGAQLTTLTIDSPLDIQRTTYRTSVIFHCSATHTLATADEIHVSAKVTITIDESALLKWQIVLDSRGANFRCDLVYELGVAGPIFAGMPFDVIEREPIDTDLLPHTPDPALTNILLGQRELNQVTTFPFQEYVARHDGSQTVALFAKGLQSYTASADGTLALTLRRSVEWLTAGNLENRLGDAGPFFYVPDARCERAVVHEIAFAFGDFDPQGIVLQRLNAAFQNPPLIVTVSGNGTRQQWAVTQGDLPVSSLRVHKDAAQMRLYNPTNQISGTVAPKQIAIEQLICQSLPAEEQAMTRILWMPSWRIGDNQGLPHPETIAELEQRAATAEAEMLAAETELQTATGDDRHRWQHKVYVHQRETLEYQLSARLNTVKLAQNGKLTEAYLYEPDPVVTEIGYQLNQLRIKRRIYDYVVAAL